MAKLKKISTRGKKTTITFEFEHNGKTYVKKSKLNTEIFEGLDELELNRHIKVRANHERNKIDISRSKTKEEEQDPEILVEAESDIDSKEE